VNALTYYNGRFQLLGEVGLAWYDAGFVFGATVTDLIRTFRHRLFRLNDHVLRFRQSCDLCRIPLEPSNSEIAFTAETLVATNSKLIATDSDLCLVMFATPGPLGRYSCQSVDGPPTLGMHVFPIPVDRYRRLFAEGARLVIPPTRHVPDASIDRRSKHRSRMHWWVAAHEAAELDPVADPLLLDADGHVTETPSANLIAVINGQLFTPPGCLAGIGLQVVREIAEAKGLAVVQRLLTPDQCSVADEIILTSTTFCIAGVSRFNAKAIPWPGPTFQMLLAAYSQLVDVDIAAQMARIH
jgi:branched-chain amino acid aminotransferase